MIINIGGIANYFLFSKKSSPDESLAADCGPGNSLLDIISRKYFGQRFDREGRLAAKGTISKRLLAILLADDYLKGKYGPSTGRERFGEKFVKKMLENASRLKLSRFDVMATTTELTAIAISNSVSTLLHRYGIKRVYLFGGGSRNKFLISRLRANMAKIELHSLDALGFNPDYIEAACYAVMGAMTIRSLAAGLPHITGAAARTIAGRIIQPAAIR